MYELVNIQNIIKNLRNENIINSQHNVLLKVSIRGIRPPVEICRIELHIDTIGGKLNDVSIRMVQN